MKIGLGTVQFGMDYGVTNSTGRVAPAEAARIVAQAAHAGVRVIDTAAAYGEAEMVLGTVLPGHPELEVVTKVLHEKPGHATPVREMTLASLTRLRRDHLYALLVHDAEDLLGADGEEVYDALLALKRDGLTARIGASVYTGAQIDRLLDLFEIDLVQIPINLFDQRLIEGGQLNRLRQSGVEVHARSVFLQGVLLSHPDSLPAGLSELRAPLVRFRAAARQAGTTPMAAALGFVRALDAVDVVVCGVTSTSELADILRMMDRDAPAIETAGLAVRDQRLVDPTRWPSSEHQAS